MRPRLWEPPVALSVMEQGIVRRIRRGKFMVFLRQIRHELFDASVQEELAQMYDASPKGQPPVPPAQLALATILQAYTGVSDDEVIEASVMDRRWQLVLDCHGCAQPPFSKGTLVQFRQRLIAHALDRRLVERTLEVARRRGGFSAGALRAALDSSPVWGAGRVEDTINLVGHALSKALGVIARQQGRGLAAVAAAAGVPLLSASSLKAALDLDWSDPAARDQALAQVLAALERVEAWLPTQPPVADERVQAVVTASCAAARQVVTQDVAWTPEGSPTIRRAVARERRISLEDPDMRHGRKSQAHRVDGYKRHVVRDLESGLVAAVGLTPANVAEARVTAALDDDLVHAGLTLATLYIDRAYLSSHWVQERGPEREIVCKAWPVRNGDRFPKTAFHLDWNQGMLRCPNQICIPFRPGAVARFPAQVCAVCPLRAHCTSSARGRSVSIHPDERLLSELRQQQATAAGRAALRQRIAVEHSLAHIGRWQGRRARYIGLRKNLFDLRRTAVVHNLHVIARLPDQQAA